MNYRTVTRKLTMALAMLLIFAIPAQAEGFSAIVTAKNMKVYADEACTWNVDTLPMTTIVTVESYEDGVAKISAGSREGYASVKDMAKLSDLAKPSEINTNTYVFQKPSLTSAALKVKKGMKVNLLATSGDWAMVENAGIVAYMNKAHLTVLGQAEEEAPQPEPTQKPEQNNGIAVEKFYAEVNVSSLRVYKSASTSSTCLGSIGRGTVVLVHAYNDKGWSAIELNGRKGFAKTESLKRVTETVTPEATPAPTQKPSTDSYINDESLSCEKRIFLFLKNEMGMNTAAACGVLANIEKESSFRPTAASYDGGYGIVQWTGGRNTKLKNFCKEKGYDYKTLEGQLWYLKHEFDNGYTKVRNYLLSVTNSPEGAYNAGYYFCYNFEIPANRAARSVQRGNSAKDTYWPKYA